MSSSTPATSSNNPKRHGFATNSLWNLLGSLTPAAVAIATTPLLIRFLGNERFSFLTIAWVFVGYFSFFDFGLGRSLTKVVAAHAGADTEHEIPSLAVTALAIIAGLAVLAGLITAGVSGGLVKHGLHIQSALRDEARTSILLIAATVPVAIVTTAFVGILEGFRKFPAINRIRIILGALLYLVPLLACTYSPTLVSVLISLMLVRLAAAFTYGAMATSLLRKCNGGFEFRRQHASRLLAIGGWLTISNVVSPLMAYFDRFFLGVMVPLGVVAYYTTPYEVLARTGIIPGALMGVAFPTIAAAWETNRGQLPSIFVKINSLLFYSTFPICAAAILMAQEGLKWWLNADFAEHSSAITRCLALGVFINTLTSVSYTALQACGKPHVTGKIHLCELPLYIVVLWLFVKQFGVVGAAYAWTFRVGIDFLLMHRFASSLSAEIASSVRRLLLVSAGGTALLLACSLLSSFETRLLTALLAILACGLRLLFMLRPILQSTRASRMATR